MPRFIHELETHHMPENPAGEVSEETAVGCKENPPACLEDPEENHTALQDVSGSHKFAYEPTLRVPQRA